MASSFKKMLIVIALAQINVNVLAFRTKVKQGAILMDSLPPKAQCSVNDHVQCPGSSTRCAGDTCCPPPDGTTGSITCPSASTVHAEGCTHAKTVDCTTQVPTVTVQAPAPSCDDEVLDAVARNSQQYPGCKCGHYQSVFCGYNVVSPRKFDVNEIKANALCKNEQPYCAKEPQRPSLETILREEPCKEWALFSVTDITISRLWRLLRKVKATAIVNPGGLKYNSDTFSAKPSANPQLHFLVPADAKYVEVIVDKKIRQGAVWGVGFKVRFNLTESGPMTRNGSSWTSSGSVQAQVFRKDDMEKRLSELNDQGVYLKEAYHYMFDDIINSESGATSDRVQVAKYYKTWATYRSSGFADEKVPSTGMWEKLDKGCFDDCRLSPITANETKVIGYSYAVRAMKMMGPKLQCHNLFRRNEFGANILSDYWWPEKPNHAIGLADNTIDHALNRKWIDRMVGPAVADSAETMKMLRSAGTQFWQKGLDTAETNGVQASHNTSESDKWTTLVLHKILAFMELTDEQADEFLLHKGTATVAMMLPSKVSHLYGPAALEWKNIKTHVYEKSLAAKFGADWAELTLLEQTKLTSGVMDALLFAGGVSVPTVIKSCFALLYGTYGQEQIQRQFGANWFLDEEKLDAFVHETIRRFPPVGGFPTWDRATNSKTSVDLRAANADRSEEGWGSHAREFWIRDVAEYEKKSVSWGDFAMVNGDNADPGSRACPAKRLSFLMIREFLRGFLQTGGTRCWQPTVLEDVKISGQGGAEFTVAARGDCRTHA